MLNLDKHPGGSFSDLDITRLDSVSALEQPSTLEAAGLLIDRRTIASFSGTSTLLALFERTSDAGIHLDFSESLRTSEYRDTKLQLLFSFNTKELAQVGSSIELARYQFELAGCNVLCLASRPADGAQRSDELDSWATLLPHLEAIAKNEQALCDLETRIAGRTHRCHIDFSGMSKKRALGKIVVRADRDGGLHLAGSLTELHYDRFGGDIGSKTAPKEVFQALSSANNLLTDNRFMHRHVTLPQIDRRRSVVLGGACMYWDGDGTCYVSQSSGDYGSLTDSVLRACLSTATVTAHLDNMHVDESRLCSVGTTRSRVRADLAEVIAWEKRAVNS